MSALHSGLFVGAALAALGCGARSVAGPSSDPCDGLAASYDVTLSPEGQTETETHFSLALSAEAGECVARMTPSGYPTVSPALLLGSSALELDDAHGPELPSLTTGWYWGLHFFREYHFRHLKLGRAADGSLDGTAGAQVDVMWAEDDICSVSESTWSGSVSADVTPPVLSAGAPSVRPPKRPSESDCFSPSGGETRPGMPEELLPWDTLAVEASEPVFGLAAGLSAEHASAFKDAPIDAQATAAGVWAWASLPDWDAVRGHSLEVHVSPSLADAAGHPVTQTTLTAQVLDVGPALERHELDSTATLATFGDVSVESGSLRIHAPCNSGLGGIAGRVATAGKSQLALRLRLDSGTSLLLSVVGKSGTKYPATTGYGAEWQTVEVPLGTESEVGFAIVPNSLCHWTSGATVWVDSVWAE